jgi:hypothetical protein
MSMQEQPIMGLIKIGKFYSSDPDDFTAGGYVFIECNCGYKGYADVDDSGWEIRGECPDCLTSFETTIS